MSPRVPSRLLLPVLALVLAAVLATSAAWVWSQTLSGAEAYTVGESLPYMPLAVDKSLGVNSDLSRLDAVEREQALAAMGSCGLRWLRQRFAWSAIEVEQGTRNWAPWDDIVEGAERHGLNLIAVLDGSPEWSRSEEDKGNSLAPPIESRHFGDFAAAFAARYRERIDYYQIWDEPNIAPHWGGREIDPIGYARLLREGAIRIVANDPGAVILAAALAPNVEPGGANMSDLQFLDALYREGAAEWFDAVAVQPYPFTASLFASPDPGQLNWRRPELMRQVMETHGDPETAVWGVSFGATGDSDEMFLDPLAAARSNWPWLGPMLWAAWLPSDTHGEYSLTGSDGGSAMALATLCELAAGPVVAWPGTYPADHASGHYVGDWRVSPAGADIGGSGDRLLVSFFGTDLGLTVRRGDYRAFLFVTVDGQPANALPRDAEGRAYVVLYDPLGRVDTVTLATGLPDGEHTAEIVTERGWGQWAIVGWTVSRDVTQAFPWLCFGLGLGAVVSLGGAVLGAWPLRRHLWERCTSCVCHYRSLGGTWTLGLTAAAAVLVYVSVGAVPSLIALSLLAALLLPLPRTGLPLIAVALPFYQLGKPILGKVFSMVEILTILTAVGWLGNWVLGLQRPLLSVGGRASSNETLIRRLARASGVSRFTALDWGVVMLVTVGAASLLWSEHVHEAAREFRTVILEGGVFYALLRAQGARNEWRDVWHVADAWLVGGGLVALVGIYQWAFGQDLITAEGVWRVRGFYGSPNNLALYLGRVFPLAVAMAIWGRGSRLARRWPTGPGQGSGLVPGRRWVWYGLAAIGIALALFLTYSRGAWLLGIPAALLFIVAVHGRRRAVVALGALIVVVAVLVLAVGTGRIASLLDTTQGTTFLRLQLWRSSWSMIVDHPVLGVGLDNFLYHYRTHYVLPTAWEEFNLSHPHNLVLDFWLRLGLPGLTVLAWLLVSYFRQAARVYGSLAPSEARLLILGLMAGMVDSVIHGLVDNAFFLVDLAFAFMLMVALVQVPARRMDRAAESPAESISPQRCLA